jgi:hypothetical protein
MRKIIESTPGLGGRRGERPAAMGGTGVVVLTYQPAGRQG